MFLHLHGTWNKQKWTPVGIGRILVGMGKNLVTIRSCKLVANRLNPALWHVLFGPNSVFQKLELIANILKCGTFHIKIQISVFP